MDLILLQPGDQALFPNSDDAAYPGLANPGQCFELVSLQQGMKQQVTTDVSLSARTSGRPLITDFTCVKYIDKVSVKLYDYCLRAQAIGRDKDVTHIYILRTAGDKTVPIMTFALRDALVSEIQLQTHPNDMATEQFKLNFTEILWRYEAGPSSGWSLARNRPIAQFT